MRRDTAPLSRQLPIHRSFLTTILTLMLLILRTVLKRTAMNFLNALRVARTSSTAVTQQFRLYYRVSSPGDVFVFFEGIPDKEFYYPEIQRRATTATIYVLICNGKSGVLHALEDVEAAYPAIKRALFFVDKDFDDILGITLPVTERLYCTDYYSIENHLVGEQAIRTVLCDLAHL